MKNYTFYWELKNLIVQFMSALDDCVIKRYDDDRVAQDDISVRVVYAPKSRTLHNLINKQQNMELPVISVSIAGIQRVPQRVFNKIDGPTILNESLTNPLQPIPINISLNVSILTKFQNDMDQILSNMIPYFDPYIIISWRHPEMQQEIRSKVEWSGNLNFSYPTDVQSTTSYRQSVDTSFTIEGWLFKRADGKTGIIHTIITDFIGVKDISEIEKDYYDLTEYDRFITSGIPVVSKVTPFYIKRDEYNTIDVFGTMLDKADSVFVSGSMFPQTTAEYIDMFSDNPRLSADNPPFYGTMIDMSKISNNGSGISTIELDPIYTSGIIDIIYLNQAGYGSITKNAKSTDAWKYGIFVV
jgi:hypothetical protein